MPLTQKERLEINTLVARFEADTGIQAVAAVTAKADAYPEIPWKAYAMGSAIGALAAALDPLAIGEWTQTGVIALDAMVILAAGALCSLVAALVPAVGRLFLDRLRARGEAQQYAQTMFLERELFRTSGRKAVLVVMCRFERIAVVVADTGLAEYAPRADLSAIGEVAGALLSGVGRGDAVAAFELAFGRLRALLQHRGFSAAPLVGNEIDDEVVVMEKGA
jgi:putative membrane protein